MAEDNKIVLKVQVEQGGSTVTLKNFENQVIKSGVAIKDLSNSIGNFTTSKLKMDGQVKVTTDQFKRLEKSVGGFKTATGASTSATLELGRVLSDMPYGIRGVANNLQQLASNLFFMSKATDAATGKSVGFGGALKNLVGGLIGPAGILIAFQGVIALFDYFSNSTNGAEKAVRTLNDANKEGAKEAGKSATEFKILSSIVLDKTSKDKDQAKAIEILNKKYKDFNTKLITNAENTKAAREEVDKYTESLVIQAKAEAALGLIKEKQGRVFLLEEETAFAIQEEGFKNVEELNIEIEKERDRMSKGRNRGVKSAAALRLKNLTNLRDSNKDEIKELNDQINRLSDLDEIRQSVLSGENKGKKGKREKVSNFDLKFADPDKDIKDAKNYLKTVARGLGVDMKKNPLEVDTDLDFNLTQETQDRLANAMAQITKDKVFSSKLREYSDYAEQTKEVITAMNDFATSEFDRELTIEQNKTNALNNELNKRLLNENLSADERERIQNKIAQNDEKLRVKQEAIERKRFKMQKAANIATALIDTFRAAAGVMAEEKGGFLQRLSAAIPTIAFGMAQVAAIARQKFQSSSGSRPILAGGGVSGGGNERAEPSFNIVGRSNDNILMSAIQSQFDQPLRAYVVARDVTNQQQLDGVISGAAST